MKCEKNIGKKNRAARLVVGIVLIALSFAFAERSWLFYLGVIIGVIMIAEAASARCVWHAFRGTKDMR